MIRAQSALMRQAREFFRAHMVGLYRFDEAPPQADGKPDPNAVRVVGEREEVSASDRREHGLGRYREIVRLVFGPWELLVRSPSDAPPLGEVALLNHASRAILISGPLDAGTWSQIGNRIKSGLHQRNLHHGTSNTFTS